MPNILMSTIFISSSVILLLLENGVHSLPSDMFKYNNIELKRDGDPGIPQFATSIENFEDSSNPENDVTGEGSEEGYFSAEKRHLCRKFFIYNPVRGRCMPTLMGLRSMRPKALRSVDEHDWADGLSKRSFDSPMSWGDFKKRMGPQDWADFEKRMGPQSWANFDKRMGPQDWADFDKRMGPQDWADFRKRMGPQSWANLEKRMGPQSWANFSKRMGPQSWADFKKRMGPQDWADFDKKSKRMGPQMWADFKKRMGPQDWADFEKRMGPQSWADFKKRMGPMAWSADIRKRGFTSPQAWADLW